MKGSPLAKKKKKKNFVGLILNSRVRVTVVQHRAPQMFLFLKAIVVYLCGINNLKYNI